MKTLLTITALLLSLSLSAQWAKKDNFITNIEVSIPSSVLVATFLTNQNPNFSEKDRQMVAATGIITSFASHWIIKKIRSKNKYRTKHTYFK